MNCLQAEENFSAYFEDALDYQTLQRFETHITGCASCQREYAQFHEFVKASQQLPQIEPSPFFMSTLQQRLSEEQREALTFWQRLQGIFVPPKWGLSVAILLILATASISFILRDGFFNPETRPLNEPSHTLHFDKNEQDTTQRPELSSETSSTDNNRFLPRATRSSDSSNPISGQPMQQHYTLKRVSYSTVSTGGGL